MKSHVIKKGKLYWNDIDELWGSLSSATIWKYADEAQDVIDAGCAVDPIERELNNAKIVKVEINEIKK